MKISWLNFLQKKKLQHTNFQTPVANLAWFDGNLEMRWADSMEVNCCASLNIHFGKSTGFVMFLGLKLKTTELPTVEKN